MSEVVSLSSLGITVLSWLSCHHCAVVRLPPSLHCPHCIVVTVLCTGSHHCTVPLYCPVIVPVLSSLYCHRCTLPLLPSLCCHHCTVITVLSSLCAVITVYCHHSTVITVVSYCTVITVVLSSSSLYGHRHRCAVNTVLYRHHCTVVHGLSSLSVIVPVLSSLYCRHCYHRHVSLLPSLYCHHCTVLTVLSSGDHGDKTFSGDNGGKWWHWQQR
jgi:hypothetical protein